MGGVCLVSIWEKTVIISPHCIYQPALLSHQPLVIIPQSPADLLPTTSGSSLAGMETCHHDMTYADCYLLLWHSVM